MALSLFFITLFPVPRQNLLEQMIDMFMKLSGSFTKAITSQHPKEAGIIPSICR